MINGIKVSVICSVYNNEKYIHQCVDSILNQSLQNIELILIDNGCTDNCTKIIDEYAMRDNRVVAVHNPKGSTYGKALNQGIAMARGDYIGIVESDDFISPTMYEKLYDQITKFSAEVCIAGFWVHINKNDNANNIHNKLIWENIDDKNIFSLNQYPLLLTVHPSIWAKLYNADFLKKIKFDEFGRYIDSKFIIDVLCSAKKIIGLKEPIYYYRFDNPNASNSNARKDKSLMIILDDWEKAKQSLKNYGLYEKYKNEFYFQASKSAYRFFLNIDNKYKKIFFKKWCYFLRDLKTDKNYKFKYLESEKIRFFKACFAKNYKLLKYDVYKTYRFLGIPIYTKKERNNCIRYYIFGIKIVEQNTTDKKLKILGIPIYVSNNNNFNILSEIKKRVTLSIRMNYVIISNIQAAHYHPESFSQYKYCFRNKDIAVVGCGPSLVYYKMIPNIKHIGINRAFKNNKILFDFLWCQDNMPEGMEAIDSYRINECVKFYGWLPNERAREVLKSCHRISPVDFYKAKANKYILEDMVKGHWAVDLTTEPIGDFQGCVFSALQFACFTLPRRIFIVGCDCSSGHFHKDDGIGKNLSYQLDAWKSFRDFISEIYPEIEVISINPIGLKGLFRDVYTESYLNTHTEIDKNNVEIINEKGEIK